jgi:hypothetical protein
MTYKMNRLIRKKRNTIHFMEISTSSSSPQNYLPQEATRSSKYLASYKQQARRFFTISKRSELGTAE